MLLRAYLFQEFLGGDTIADLRLGIQLDPPSSEIRVPTALGALTPDSLAFRHGLERLLTDMSAILGSDKQVSHLLNVGLLTGTQLLSVLHVRRA